MSCPFVKSMSWEMIGTSKPRVNFMDRIYLKLTDKKQALCKEAFTIIKKSSSLKQWFPKSAPRTTNGPRGYLEWSANP